MQYRAMTNMAFFFHKHFSIRKTVCHAVILKICARQQLDTAKITTQYSARPHIGVYMWFKPDGPITREEYADVATTLIREGLKNIK